MRNDKKYIRMNTTEIHYSLWGVLTEVDRICKANAIPYTLIFGSLLGCVRDGGFIPWDDDVDIAILPGYWHLFNRVLIRDVDFNRFFVLNEYSDDDYPWKETITKVGVLNTYRYMPYYSSDYTFNRGIHIDIYPMTYVKNKFAFLCKSILFSMTERIKSLLIRNDQVHSRVLLRIRDSINRYKQVNSILNGLNRIERRLIHLGDKNTGLFLVIFTTDYSWKKTIFKSKWFGSIEYRDFVIKAADGGIVDERQFPTPCDVDGVLTTTYGNWRKRISGRFSKNLSYRCMINENRNDLQ